MMAKDKKSKRGKGKKKGKQKRKGGSQSASRHD